MAISSARVTVSTTATELTGTDTFDRFAGEYASKILVKNPAAGTTFYIGGPTVTSATGLEVAAGEFVSLPIRERDRLYAITASGSQAAHVLYLDIIGG